MTNEEIIAIADRTKTAEPGRDGYVLPISFARAILAAARLKSMSFGEKYPRNPDATCNCEHWQQCSDCHPTYNAKEPK